MSVAFHFRQNNNQPLDPGFIESRLNGDLIVTNTGLLKETDKLRSFCVRSPKYDLNGWEEEGGLCFVWSEWEEDDNLMHSAYSVSGLHLKDKKLTVNIINLLADVARKLAFVIDDPQTGKKGISPDYFISLYVT